MARIVAEDPMCACLSLCSFAPALAPFRNLLQALFCYIFFSTFIQAMESELQSQ